jgi:branched-chain amino acid transport system substrate-binding protein
MSRRLSSAIIGLIVLVACCVTPVSAADKIKIGYTATMSGPAASLGQDILDGFKLGMTHVENTLGGLPVDLIVGDDQLQLDVGVQVASKMVEKDKVDFITGVVFSNVMMAVAR